MKAGYTLVLCLAVLAVLTLLPVPGRAAAEVWRVLSDERFPPYAYSDNGIASGVDAEIVNAVLHRIGVTPAHEPQPWNRVLRRLETGDFDMAYQFVATEERRQKYLLVGPFRTGRTVLMTRRDRGIVFRGLDDLNGLTVVTVQGYAYTRDFDAATGFLKLPVAEVRLGVRMLAAGRVDAMIGDIWSLAHAAEEEGLTALLQVLPNSLNEVGRHVMFPKGAEDKAARFAEGLRQITADGTLQRIIDRWLNPSLVQLPQ